VVLPTPVSENSLDEVLAFTTASAVIGSAVMIVHCVLIIYDYLSQTELTDGAF
jgi:hypothetical protein